MSDAEKIRNGIYTVVGVHALILVYKLASSGRRSAMRFSPLLAIWIVVALAAVATQKRRTRESS